MIPTKHVSAECLELGRRGQWRDAWTRFAADAIRRSDLQLTDLLWLHDLCNRLGAEVRRAWLGRRLCRAFPEAPTVGALRVRDALRHGRFATAWQLARCGPACTTPEETADWAMARARVHAALREFPLAWRLLDEARRTTPDDPHVDMEDAWTWQAQDRLDRALEICAAARARWPDDPRLLLQECWFLHDAGNPDALQRMATVRQAVQSPVLDGIYANHCFEAGQLEEAKRVWTEMLADPLHEPRTRSILRVALTRVCRELGDDHAALAHADSLRGAAKVYAEKLRAHLQRTDPPGRTRVTLPVPFVRQDHLTCSPATMASLLATFGVTIDQREIAAQITYDGTASQDELTWAQARGFVVRFFQFEPEAARRLLDAGLPFAVTTRFESSGHRQAVCGYDRVLDTFLLRDPMGNFRREVDASWLATITARGGECALILPADVAARTTVPELPDEAATMESLQLRLDWKARRLDAAERRLAALLALPPSPLRQDIELRACAEREDRRRQLELYEQAFRAAPDDAFWQFHYVAELLDQNQWQKARSLLEQWVPTTRSPFLQRMLADQLRTDVRQRPQALHWMERALRLLGQDPRTWQRHGSLLWDDPTRRDEALEAWRIATALAPQDEWLAWSYAQGLRELGRGEGAIEFLRERVATLGTKSAAPACTLARWLHEQHRPDEAVEVLRAAVAIRGDAEEAHQQLFELLIAQRRLDEAEALLASHGFRPTVRAMGQHSLARLRGDQTAARAALDACLAADPRHEEANRLLLESLLERDGLAVAAAAATRLAVEHDGDPTLLLVAADFHQRIERRADAETILRRLVDAHPHEHWLRGRLARHLLDTGRAEDAQPLLAQLRVTSPNSSPLWLDIAAHERSLGNHAAARDALRRSLELAPDNRSALRHLVDWAKDAATAAEDLRFAMERIANHPVPPTIDVLVNFVGLADAVPRPECMEFLTRLERDFPGTVAPSVAKCEFVLRTTPADAVPLAEAIVRQKPWNAQHHLRLAACLRANNKRAEERAALEHLLQMDPGCAQAFVELGESLDREGRVAEASAVFRRGLLHHPGSAVLHGMTADTAWRLGDRAAAMASIERACDLDRSYAWALSTRVDWLVEFDRHAEARAFAESLVEASPRWAPAHEILARALDALGEHAERVATLRRALDLSPRLGFTRLQLLDALIELRQFDEARAVLAAGRELSGDDPSLMLRDVQIERSSGDLAAARQRLHTWLATRQDFASGWIRYMTWCEEEGRDDDILALHRAPPNAIRENEVLYGFAADVMLRRGDDDGAARALEKALALEPGYHWARDTLCGLVLRTGQPNRIFELLPDHEEPRALPFFRAALVAEAAARTGRADLAHRAFDRLLQDPAATSGILGKLDDVLRIRLRKAHEARIRDAMRADPTTPVAENLAKISAMRGRAKEYLRALSRIHGAHPAPRADIVAAAILCDVARERAVPGVADWVAANVRGPIVDTEAMGDLLYALSDAEGGARQCVRLFGNDWRRPDARGWMLANLAEALQRLGDPRVVAVCTFALEELPQDHSVWWHRRHLAEQAIRERRWADARALCVMPVHDHHDIRLLVHQFDLVAELRTTPWLRRGAVLRRRLRESFRRGSAARRAGKRVDYRPQLLFRACPHPLTLAMCCGRLGTSLVQCFYGP